VVARVALRGLLGVHDPSRSAPKQPPTMKGRVEVKLQRGTADGACRSVAGQCAVPTPVCAPRRQNYGIYKVARSRRDELPGRWMSKGAAFGPFAHPSVLPIRQRWPSPTSQTLLSGVR
jgi:hypothetical protein